MAIEYPGGTVLKTTLDGTTKTTFVASMYTALTTVGWTAAARSGGWRFTSATTPHGLSMKADCYDDGGAYPIFHTLDADGNYIGGFSIISGAFTFDFIASRYNMFMSLPGVTASSGVGFDYYANSFATGIPFLPEPLQPLIVSGATNATPIEVTTTAAHGMITGTTVYITGVAGNTAANGSFVITSTGTTTFTLGGSVGNGAYTSGGLVGSAERLSRLVYQNNNQGSTSLDVNGWRRDPFQTISTSGITSYSYYAANGSVGSGPALLMPLVQPTQYPWRGNRSSIVEPYMNIASSLQGQVYGAAVIRGTPVPSRDTLFTMDGHDWMVYGVGGTNSALAIAYT